MEANLKKTLDRIAAFYDARKVGHVGPLGFRRSTALARFRSCLDKLIEKQVIVPGQTRFLDLGCADGRVNVFLSFLTRVSVGIELDEWTLDEFGPLKKEKDLFKKFPDEVGKEVKKTILQREKRKSEKHKKQIALEMANELALHEKDFLYEDFEI